MLLGLWAKHHIVGILIDHQFIGALGGGSAARCDGAHHGKKHAFDARSRRKTPPRDGGGPYRKALAALPQLSAK